MTTLDRAIFIDGDTLILEPVEELFQLLDDFDVALCVAPQLHHPKAIESNLHSFLPPVSMALAEFNAGLIVARNTEKFRAFMKSWIQLFRLCLAQQYGMDQVALRVALAKSDLRIATLPNNYNFRANINQSVAGTVKILHCHGELQEIAQIVNQQNSIRIYQPGRELVHGLKPRAAGR
jgi:lipopolysaccharide biosynthesis glycosyltransferase